MKNRRGCIVLLAVAGISCMVGLACWRALQPKIRLAPEAEVRAKFDPRLMVGIPSDPKAIERYGRFAEISNDKNLPPSEKRKRLAAIIAEGPLEAPTSDGNDFPKFARLGLVFGELQKEVLSMTATDPDQALATMIETLRLQNALTNSPRSITGFLLATSSFPTIAESCRDLVPHLNERQALRLLTTVKESPGMKETLRKCVLAESKSMPRRFALFGAPNKEELEKNLREMSDGTFDALQTAELSNEMYLALLTGIDKPLDKVDKALDDRVGRLQESVPQTEDYEKLPDGWEKELARFAYRVKLNNHPNSWGVSIAGPPSYLMLQSLAKRRNQQAMLTVFVALHIYRLRYGTLPSTLEQLVSDGLINQVPLDAVNAKPLKLDTQVRVLTSANEVVGLK